ncbi:relaxase/mobilization nuclease domain-containing protein [Qipengyuania seohaensis]|uniref:relaxase/mobilization nuclease domain-containing protein n=1 Tax=Qipengyuania seohaensis TaxID=266951 RepID=UPI000C223631|nr:relaxase/mobilization nuclease domain-containing protein [Qipengyuania seohaensis]
MITKRIKARKNLRQITRERIAHARSLIDYLLAPEKESDEKAYMVDYMLRAGFGDSSGVRLLHSGYRNLLSNTEHARRAEMMALANAATRSPNPVDHWLLSWREDEKPTSKQVDETVEMFLGHLGLGGQPAIYVLHGDTNNLHCHIAVNRFDMLNRRMIEINHGFNKEAAHQAVAKIVDHFGWQAEEKQRYVVVGGKTILSKRAAKLKAVGHKPICTGASAAEWRTGFKSVQRIAQEEAVPIILNARSWPELHERLAAKGMTYERVGTNGIKIGIGEEFVSASRVNSRITMIRRAKDLGDFVARRPSVKVEARSPEQDVLPNAKGAIEFRELCDEYRADRKRKKKLRELERLRGTRKQNATEIARAALLQNCEARPEPEFAKPPPNLESFHYWKNDGETAAKWCRRKDLFPSLTGQEPAHVEPRPIGGFVPFQSGNEVRYARHADAPTVFVDRGDRIDVILAVEDEVIVAALRLSAQKFHGKVSVTGSRQFRERAFELAQRNGLGGCLIDQDFVDRRAAEDRERRPSDATSNINRSAMSGTNGQAVNLDFDIGTLAKLDSQPSECVTGERPRSHPPNNAASDATDAAERNKQQNNYERTDAESEAVRSAPPPAAASAESPERVPSRGSSKGTNLPLGPQKGKSR